MTKAQAWKTYRSLAKPVGNAGDALFGSLKGSDTRQQVAAKAVPLVVAYRTGDAKLLRLARNYPPAAADIKAMVKANQAFVIDLTNARQVSALTVQQWDQRFVRDARRAAAAINVVQSDLQ